MDSTREANKIQTMNELVKTYLDRDYGRYCKKPVMEVKEDPRPYGNIDQEHMHLQNGLTHMLIALHGMLELGNNYRFQRDLLERHLKVTQTELGLYSRFPMPYLVSEHHDPVSIDEYRGIMTSLAFFPELHAFYGSCILSYGETHSWAFIDDLPNYDPISRLGIKGALSVLKLIPAIVKDVVSTKDFDGSSSLDKILKSNPKLEALTRIRLPAERAFIRLCMGEDPGLISNLHFILSILSAAKKQKASSVIMKVMQIVALRHVGHKGILFDYAVKKFHGKLVEDLGKQYFKACMAKQLGGEHPLTLLSKDVDALSKVRGT